MTGPWNLSTEYLRVLPSNRDVTCIIHQEHCGQCDREEEEERGRGEKGEGKENKISRRTRRKALSEPKRLQADHRLRGKQVEIRGRLKASACGSRDM
jgi:hypothetical protein